MCSSSSTSSSSSSYFPKILLQLASSNLPSTLGCAIVKRQKSKEHKYPNLSVSSSSNNQPTIQREGQTAVGLTYYTTCPSLPPTETHFFQSLRHAGACDRISHTAESLSINEILKNCQQSVKQSTNKKKYKSHRLDCCCWLLLLPALGFLPPAVVNLYPFSGIQGVCGHHGRERTKLNTNPSTIAQAINQHDKRKAADCSWLLLLLSLSVHQSPLL